MTDRPVPSVCQLLADLHAYRLRAMAVLLRLRRVAGVAAAGLLCGLLSVPAYYVAAGFLVPPLAGPGGTAAWDGPLRITLSFLPFAVVLGVVLAAALRRARRTPAGGPESRPPLT